MMGGCNPPVRKVIPKYYVANLTSIGRHLPFSIIVFRGNKKIIKNFRPGKKGFYIGLVSIVFLLLLYWLYSENQTLLDSAPAYPGSVELNNNEIADIVRKYGCYGLNVGVRRYKVFATKDREEQIYDYYRLKASERWLKEAKSVHFQASSDLDTCFYKPNFDFDPSMRRPGGELMTGLLIYDSINSKSYIEQHFPDAPASTSVVVLLAGNRAKP